jgi:predicted nucleotidyltransferase
VDEMRELTLAKLAATAESQGLNVLLLGAFARDLLFWHMHNIECHRATMDVDVVVQLKDWAAYHKYRQALLDLGFREDAAVDHPEKLTDPQTGVEVDLLPFGEIAEDGKTVIWPEDDSKWSVVGIQDAYDHAFRLDIIVNDIHYEIPFISIPALVLLKIIAAHDRPAARAKKDTVDIGFVISHYLATGNRTRLESPPNNDILEVVHYDLDRATAQLLGRDIGEIVSDATRSYLKELLKKETTSRSLCLFTQGIQSAVCKGDFARARLIVRDILDGARGVTHHISHLMAENELE